MRSAGWCALGELGFELGDAPVSEAVVGAGGFQPFLQGPVVLCELAGALLERGFSVASRCAASGDRSCSRSRIWPSRMAMRRRCAAISASAVFSAASAVSARSRQDGSW